MDPNETLRIIRRLVVDMGDDGLDAVEVGNELADRVHDLDEWLVKGGFPPDEWSHETVPDGRCSRCRAGDHGLTTDEGRCLCCGVKVDGR